MATFYIPQFRFYRRATEQDLQDEKRAAKKEQKKQKKDKKRGKERIVVPTTFAEQARCEQIRSLANCPACRPGTLYRQQVGAQGSCCADRSRITSKVNNLCGVGFACVGRGKSGLPCTLAQPANPCPCTACSCLPDPLPCGVRCL